MRQLNGFPVWWWLKNNEIRIYLNSHDLNKAIMDSHYSLPTIEQATAFLSRAKVFTVLDEKLDSGKSNWMNSQVTLQPLTLLLRGSVG